MKKEVLTEKEIQEISKPFTVNIGSLRSTEDVIRKYDVEDFARAIEVRVMEKMQGSLHPPSSLPDKETTVLLAVEKEYFEGEFCLYWTMAEYLRRWDAEYLGDDEAWADWRVDVAYYPEGWYEIQKDNAEEERIPLSADPDIKILGWCELPPLPTGDDK